MGLGKAGQGSGGGRNVVTRLSIAAFSNSWAQRPGAGTYDDCSARPPSCIPLLPTVPLGPWPNYPDLQQAGQESNSKKSSSCYTSISLTPPPTCLLRPTTHYPTPTISSPLTLPVTLGITACPGQPEVELKSLGAWVRQSTACTQGHTFYPTLPGEA